MSELKMDTELKSAPKAEKKEGNWLSDTFGKVKDAVLQTERTESEKKKMAEIFADQQKQLKEVADRYHAEKAEVIGTARQSKADLLNDIKQTVARLEMEKTPAFGGDESQRKVAEDAYERLEAKITGSKEVVDFKNPEFIDRAIANLNEFANAITNAPAADAKPAADKQPVDEKKPAEKTETASGPFRFSNEDLQKIAAFGLKIDKQDQAGTVIGIPDGYSATMEGSGDKISAKSLSFPTKEFKSATASTSVDKTSVTIVAETHGGTKVAVIFNNGKTPEIAASAKQEGTKKAPEVSDSENSVRETLKDVKVPKGHTVEYDPKTRRVSVQDKNKRTVAYFTAGNPENKDKADAAGMQKWLDRVEKRLQPAPAKASEGDAKKTAEASDGKKTHTVQKGETLTGIAKAEGVSLNELKMANPYVTDTKLKIWGTLIIPTKPADKSAEAAAEAKK